MTPHHVLTRLAKYFHVLWLEPAHHWREISLRGPHRKALHETAEALPEGFHRYVPEAWLPDIYRPAWLRQSLFRQRILRSWHRLETLGCQTFVLHLWHPQFEPALSVGRHDLSVYHIDDEYSFSADAPPVGLEEARVIRSVNHIFTISPGLMERKGGLNPHTTMVPEGVDFRLYAKHQQEPRDIAPIRHPRIGYTGNLKRQLDWQLLKALAHKHPNWSFVYVGPLALDREGEAIAKEISQLDNVHFLGPKTVTDLAAYPQHFDVCIMPYVVNGYTNNIYPLKLHEYLASGTPVVGSPIRSLLDFTHVIDLASSVEEWSTSLAAALVSPAASASSSAARQAVARQFDWSELIFRIASTICKRLSPELAAKMRTLTIDSAELPQ